MVLGFKCWVRIAVLLFEFALQIYKLVSEKCLEQYF